MGTPLALMTTVAAAAAVVLLAVPPVRQRLTRLCDELVRRTAAVQVARLLSAVVTLDEPPTVELTGPVVLSRLIRGLVPDLGVTVAQLHMQTLPVTDVTIDLQGIRVDVPRTLRRRWVVLRAGEGRLQGHVPGEEVRRRSRVPGMVRLTGGRAALKLPGLLVGVRPVVRSGRVRLSPTPFSMTVPPLPDGVVLTSVDTTSDALRVECRLDLPRLPTARP